MSEEHEQRRLTAARQCIRLRREGSVPERHESWMAWWEAMYGDGETFAEYVTRKQKEKEKSG